MLFVRVEYKEDVEYKEQIIKIVTELIQESEISSAIGLTGEFTIKHCVGYDFDSRKTYIDCGMY